MRTRLDAARGQLRPQLGTSEGSSLDALNTLRAVLVGVAFIAALILAFDGQWIPAAVLGVGIAAHFGLWAWLRAEKRRDAEADPLAGLSP